MASKHCRNLYVDNGWYYGPLAVMLRKFKFDKETDVVFCRRLAEAERKIIEARWDRGEDYIPF